MEFVQVSSSQIREVAYDAESEKLQIRFTNGSLYEYSGVPKDVYDSLVGAESVGRYFGQAVKWAYPYQRIE